MSTFILKTGNKKTGAKMGNKIPLSSGLLSGGQIEECSKAAEPRQPTNHANQSEREKANERDKRININSSVLSPSHTP